MTGTLTLVQAEDRSVELYRAYFGLDDAGQTAATAEYKDVLQPMFLAHYGADADAGKVDPWMADVYSDLYKDRNGIRPRGHTYATMKAWMDNIPPLDEQDDFDPEEADRQDEIARMNDAYYSFDDRQNELLADHAEVYGVSAHLFAATALRGVGRHAEEY